MRGLLAAALAIGALAPAAALAQQAPYLKDARPWSENTTGISGLWDMNGYLSSSIYSAHDRAAKTIDGQKPPLLPGPAKLLDQRLVDADTNNKPFPNTASQCLPQGVPYMIFAAVGGPLQILETPGQVTFINDAYNEMWLVYMTDKHPPADDLEPNYHGDSIGHWEGDTLIIDTISLNDKTTLDQVGTPHSTDLHVITRVRRADAKTLEFVVTIDDPKTFSKPWQRRVTYKPAAPGSRISEVVCENQRNGPGQDGFQTSGFGPPAK